uniref:CMP-N-acetylneuraminate-beta-galactosamide- alpha-2,3-sialyltransferase 1 isoform X2 n=1 Tax=Ictidomys tridecemlineatus TaxID=43179 RepID=UPI001A9F550E|nr:CMP-N-acetylneuraminate-beta-galactosamide-alpha-2,3-sialyltransferase 1 isoform X2 [Ictidomys tridecemlineatus]
MKVRYWTLCLTALFMLSLWMMASFLNQKVSLDVMDNLRLRICRCSRNISRKCSCLSKVRECSACLYIPGESDWFDRHFEKGIEPLMSENSMSYDALGLWLGLQRVRSQKNVKSMQLTNVFPAHSLDHLKSGCQTCAVVGNSRSLLGSGLGFRINQHDVVLRMNKAPVQGFETDVGNTTTLRIMQPEIASTESPEPQLLLPLNSSGLRWMMTVLRDYKLSWKPRNPGFRIVHFTDVTKDKVLIISISFLKYIQENWLENYGQYPSLGFVALMYALHTCDQVSLFGFGVDHHNRWTHYWDDKYLSYDIMRKFPKENDVIIKLQCEGKVAVYR